MVWFIRGGVYLRSPRGFRSGSPCFLDGSRRSEIVTVWWTAAFLFAVIQQCIIFFSPFTPCNEESFLLHICWKQSFSVMHPSHSLPLSATFPAHTHTRTQSNPSGCSSLQLAPQHPQRWTGWASSAPTPPSVWRLPSLWASADLPDIPLIYGCYIICSNIIHRATACLLASLSGAITDSGYRPEDGTKGTTHVRYEHVQFDGWVVLRRRQVTKKTLYMLMYVFEWVPEIVYTCVLKAGRREEVNMGGSGDDCPGERG